MDPSDVAKPINQPNDKRDLGARSYNPRIGLYGNRIVVHHSNSRSFRCGACDKLHYWPGGKSPTRVQCICGRKHVRSTRLLYRLQLQGQES
jgi:hypothetical protein